MFLEFISNHLKCIHAVIKSVRKLELLGSVAASHDYLGGIVVRKIARNAQ